MSLLPDFPLIQHLHGGLSRAMPGAMLGSRSGGVGSAHTLTLLAGLGCRSARCSVAISTAAIGGFPAFVRRTVARSLERLLDRVGRQHAEGHRHAGRRRGVGDAVRARRRDVLEVRRSRRESDSPGRPPPRTCPRAAASFAANGISNAPGTLMTQMSSLSNAGRLQPFERAGLQPIGDEVVELRHDERELQSRRFLRAFDRQHVCDPYLHFYRYSFFVYFPVNSGFPLLEKRPRAFLHVLGRRHHAEERRFELTAVGERHLEPAVDGLHRVPQRDRRLGRQLRRERARFVHQVGRRHDTIHQPDGKRLRGRRSGCP